MIPGCILACAHADRPPPLMFIYVHLPFCLSHCIYCDFYVELKATAERRRAYLDALKREIIFYLGQSSGHVEPIQTVYFGGGTPGLFPALEIQEILALLARYAPLHPEAEITLEANPEGMADSPEAYRTVGINRLSIGVQSFQPNELKRLSRVHSRDAVYRFVRAAQAAGFDNLSIDLMYGIPEQTTDSWQDTLNQAVSLGIQHISMYGLQVEPETALEKLLGQGRLTLPPEDDTVEMYFTGVSFLEAAGFNLYEISNLAHPDRASRHNLNYWENGTFWGFGVSAHGYMHGLRYENAMSLADYLADPPRRSLEYPCTPQERLENALIFGLRKTAGVSVTEIERTYQIDFRQCYGDALARFLDAGLLKWEGDTLCLTRDAIPISNEILAVFLN